MGQLGFFDLNRRYEKNDPLVAIAAMVPFESFRSKLKAALIKGELRTSDATHNYNLSDDQAEYQLRDRLSSWGKRARWKSCLICLTGS